MQQAIFSNIFFLILFLGKLKKPSKENLITWLDAALENQQFEDQIFFKIIFRTPEEMNQEKSKNVEQEIEKELVLEEETYFEEI